MDTTSTDRSASSPSPPSTGGTTATNDSATSTNLEKLSDAQDHLECQNKRSTDNSLETAINEHEMASHRQYQITALSPPSPLSSPTPGSHISSPSFLAKSPLRGLVEDLSKLDSDSNKATMQCEPLSQQRSRMLSAPLPSVPPSTPNSSGYRVSQVHNYCALPSPPSALLSSPRFIRSRTATSPLVRHRTESERSLESEGSDTPSVEIISADIEDSFVTGRFEVKDGSLTSRGLLSSRHAPFHSSESAVETTGSVSRNVVPRPNTTASSISHHMLHIFSPATSGIESDKQKIQHSPNSSFSSVSRGSLTKSSSSEERTHSYEGSTMAYEGNSFGHSMTPANSLNDGSNIPQPTQDSSGAVRTPNVYINGLPPHFSDESLYAMTRDFGHVLSVRTFTRCVGEKMSGYGFVLFDSVDAAERCIESLRKYRNLHPSFSKQVHKIPGTPYASGAITIPPAGSVLSLNSQQSISSSASFPSLPSLSSTLTSSTSYSVTDGMCPGQSLNMAGNAYGHRTTNSLSDASASSISDFSGGSVSFREKMEKLKDDKSTNLYMEGLPLSIDDVSLAALVSPHKVVSRRFFQTKLSDPPRMIAFVRLETRSAAEEVIERLHGRVVRGWNDNGCRISVRFADTNEQRELRRSERLARGEDEDVAGASRLSMAHAALINLRGAEAQVQSHPQAYQQRDHAAVGHPLQARQGNPNSHGNHVVSVPASTGAFCHTECDPTLQIVSPNRHQAGRNMLPALTHTNSLSAFDISAFHPSINSALNLQAGLPSMGQSTFNNGMQPTLSSKALEASRLALLQQEAQLKQLQLLQQIQSLSECDSDSLNSIFESQVQAQKHALMPSANIGPKQNGDQFGGEARLPSTLHYAQASPSKIRPRDKVLLSSVGNEFQSGAGLADTKGYSSQPSSQIYNSIFGSPRHAVSRADPPLFRNSPGKTSCPPNHSGETAVISPSLTFASRTPSTMSPATPFFSTFGTPASAPATFPKRKQSIHDQDYQRILRSEVQN